MTRYRTLLWGMIAIGVVARAIVAFKTYGFRYDMDSLVAVRDGLRHHTLDVYSAVNGHPWNRWPYPPGFFPWVVASNGLANLTGHAFHGFVQLAEIGADGAIAWLVQDHLGRRGVGERARLAAAGLVALGPSFAIVSGFHGQIDSAAILPALLALWLWERMPPGGRRAVLAGVLIGVGISIKTVPGLMLFALLPSVRSRREAAALVLPAIAVPLLALAPFLIADHHAAIEALRSHRALPGIGGIGLLAQPDLLDQWRSPTGPRLSSFSQFLTDHEFPLVTLLMAPFVAVVLLRRPSPTHAAALLWCALPLLSIGFAFQYVVWALPFALMAGYLWQVAALQLALLFPTIVFEWQPFDPSPTAVYVVVMIAVWLVALGAVVRMALRLYRPRPAPPGAVAAHSTP